MPLRMLLLRSLVALTALGVCAGAAALAPLYPPAAAFSGRQAADCSFGGRACFDVRVELLLEPAYSTAGFYEPPAVRAQALQREVYRQLLMDRTALACRPIGGEVAVLRDRGRISVAHVVPAAEAFASGLSAEEMPEFVADTLNLTIAHADEIRRRGDRDPAGYLPQRNACWYVWRWLVVKQSWALSVDEAEASVLQRVFGGCAPERFARLTCFDADIDRDREDAARGRL